jgi:hypothetical protein
MSVISRLPIAAARSGSRSVTSMAMMLLFRSMCQLSIRPRRRTPLSLRFAGVPPRARISSSSGLPSSLSTTSPPTSANLDARSPSLIDRELANPVK